MKISLLIILGTIALHSLAGESKYRFDARDVTAEAGPKPKQTDQTPPEIVDKWVRRGLKNPASLVYEGITDCEVGATPGGRPCWVVTVTYRATNSYGGYISETESYYIQKDRVVTVKKK